MWRVHSRRSARVLFWPEPWQLWGDHQVLKPSSIDNLTWKSSTINVKWWIHLMEPWKLRGDHQFLKPTWVDSLSNVCTIHVNIRGDPEHVPNKPLPSSPHGLRPCCPEGSSVLGNWWGSSENKYQDLPHFLFSYCVRVEMTCQWRPAVPSSIFPKWTAYRVRRLFQDMIW